MKRLLIILPLVLILVCCGKNKSGGDYDEESPTIWIIPSDASIEETKAILADNRYSFDSLDTTTNGRNIYALHGDKYIIDYLGHEWNAFTIVFIDDELVGITFNSHEKTLPEYAADRLVYEIDKLYGTHRESHGDRDDVFLGNPIVWEWESGEIYADLAICTAVKENDIAIFNIYLANPDDLKPILNF